MMFSQLIIRANEMNYGLQSEAKSNGMESCKMSKIL